MYMFLKQMQVGHMAIFAYIVGDPESGEGLVVALKRPENKEGRKTLKLKGLDGEASYQVTNLDTKKSWTVAGSQLMGAGLEIELANQPDSALIQYLRVEK